MPRPSRSTLTMPISAQSSLSHWMTTRPGSWRVRAARPNRALPGNHHATRVLAEVTRQVLDTQPEIRKRLHARHVEDRPAAARLRPSVSLGSVNSKLFMTFASLSISSSCSDSAFPTSRAALRLDR